MIELNEEVLQKVAELEQESAELKEGIPAMYTNIGQLYYEKPEGYESNLAAIVEQLDGIKEKVRRNYTACLELKGLCLCENCNNEVEIGATFCGECGSRIKVAEEPDGDSKICARCGSKNGKDKKYCTNCGQKLEETEAVQAEAEPELTKTCPSCGTSLPTEAVFCAECGMHL
ncbi:MAG: zinc ribbon domain-containing protein [Lachnospiraceae bacterium]|nr:zinc ribbon domain-containing protein [Lachnospiraceae bacterium]